MWNTPTEKRLSKIPKFYATEHVPIKEKIIYLHIFIGGCDWYIAEYDGTDTFFGYSILNSDYEFAEWGYISFSELKRMRVDGFEVDCETEEFWVPKRACDVRKICRGMKWAFPKKGGLSMIDNSKHTFNELLRQASFDSKIDVDCPECFCPLTIDREADEAWCSECGKLVREVNPLFLLGYFDTT